MNRRRDNISNFPIPIKGPEYIRNKAKFVIHPSIIKCQEETWEIYFLPHGGCTEAIVRELNKSKSNMLAQSYSFTPAPIAKALLDAHKREVKVEVIPNKNQKTTQSFASLEFILNEGIAFF